MQTLAVSPALSVCLYDSIKEFPASLQLEAKQYAIMQSGLATTPDELTRRKERMELLLSFDKKAEYHLEAHNYQLAQRLMEIDFNPAELEWACHLHSINGEPVTNHSEDELVMHLANLKAGGLNSVMLLDSLRSISEQMQAETKRYYPNRVGTGGHLNNLQRYIRYGLALVENIEQADESSKAKLNLATLDLLTAQKPLNFKDGPGNVLVNLERSQFKLYTTLQESGCVNPESLSVYQLYGWIEVLEERSAQQRQTLNAAKKR